MDATFVTRLAVDGAGGLRIAVKDCIDVAGVPTTCGSPAVAEAARPAHADAACVAPFRAAGAVVVGKTNLHELCFGSTGVNPWYGTPRNPLDPDCIPGGSSSGSAVAVATGEADLGIGTDTTGSVRTPAACCGLVALKPTYGAVPIAGVARLAPSLDVVGLIARDVAGLERGSRILDPAWVGDGPSPAVVGRVRPPGVDPRVDDAVDRLLAAAEVEAVEVTLPGYEAAVEAGRRILFGEAWIEWGGVYRAAPDRMGEEVRDRFEAASAVTAEELAAAYVVQRRWRRELADVLARVPVLAFATFPTPAPRIDARDSAPNDLAIPASLAGLPAVALPVPLAGSLPGSVQLVGPTHAEVSLLAAARLLERAGEGGPG